jgi:hypothetical protein
VTETSSGWAGATAPSPRTGRAAERAAFGAARAGEYDPTALADAMAARLAEEQRERAGPEGVALTFAVGNAQRWVPIGPSVSLRGGQVGDVAPRHRAGT